MKSIKQRRQHRTKKRNRHHKIVRRTKKLSRHNKRIHRTRKRRLDKNVIAKGPKESKDFLNEILIANHLDNKLIFKTNNDGELFLHIKSIGLDVYPHIHIYNLGLISFHTAPRGIGGITIKYDGEPNKIIPKIKQVIELIKERSFNPLWLQLYRGLLKYYISSKLSEKALQLKALLIADIQDNMKGTNIGVEEEEPENINTFDTSETIFYQAVSKMEELKEEKELKGNAKFKKMYERRIGLIDHYIETLSQELGLLVPSPALEPEFKPSSEFKLSPEYISPPPSPLRLSDLAVSEDLPESTLEEVSDMPDLEPIPENLEIIPEEEESTLEEVSDLPPVQVSPVQLPPEPSSPPSRQNQESMLRMCNDMNDINCLPPSREGSMLSSFVPLERYKGNNSNQRDYIDLAHSVEHLTLLEFLRTSGVTNKPVQDEERYIHTIRRILGEKGGVEYLATRLSIFLNNKYPLTKKDTIRKLMRSIDRANILQMDTYINSTPPLFDKVNVFLLINADTIANIKEVNDTITIFWKENNPLKEIYIYNTTIKFLRAILNMFENVKSEFYLFIESHPSYHTLDGIQLQELHNAFANKSFHYNSALLLISLITEVRK